MFKNTLKNPAFDWSDFCLLPKPLSKINSRSQIKNYHLGENRLIIASPMDTVVNLDNWYTLMFDGDMDICLPRGVYIDNNIVWNSISLDEFALYVAQLEAGDKVKTYHKLLIDIANGNLERLYSLTKRFMKLRTNVKLMVGNISNVETFKLYAELGVDSCRLGVGGGQSCTTSANTGVHLPLAYLVSECYNLKKENGYNTKLIGDGGFKNFDEIIKAIAIGCDSVMLGSILNKSLESCGDTFLWSVKINKYKTFIWNKFPLLRKYMVKSFRGMSTKEVQRSWNKEKLTTAEGICKINSVDYTIKNWSENFIDYLKSAMSYCNAETIEEFRDCQKIFISQNAFKRYHK